MGKKKPTADKTVTFKVIKHPAYVPVTASMAAGIEAANKANDDFAPTGNVLADITRQMVNRIGAQMEAEARANWILQTGQPFDETAFLADRRDKLIRQAWRQQEEQERWEWVALYCPNALRPVLELHDPFNVDCLGCDPGDYEEGPAGAPCSTALLVEQLTVEAVG